jgi:hypothetical protein
MAHSIRTASLIALLCAVSLPASAQTDRRVRLEAGAGFSTNLVEDENGTTVSYALGPALGAAMAWTLTTNTNGIIGARLSRSGVNVELAGDSKSAGSGWVFDVRGLIERQLGPCAEGAPGCTAIHAGAGALWANGPDDIVPFTISRGAMLTGEAGIAVRIVRSRPIFLTGSGQVFRLGGASASDPIEEAGTVTRIVVGVRHGR